MVLHLPMLKYGTHIHHAVIVETVPGSEHLTP